MEKKGKGRLRDWRPRTAWWFGGALLLASCGGMGEQAPPATFPEVLEALVNPPLGGVAAPDSLGDGAMLPDNVADALIPPMGIESSSSESGASAGEGVSAPAGPTDYRIDLIMSEGGATPARDLFLSLVEGTRYSMIVHPDVDQTIALPLTLVDVTVHEAVETICDIYNLDCSFREPDRTDTWGSFRVFPRRLSMRTFRVDVLAVARNGSSNTSVSSSSGDSTTTTTDAGASTTSTSTSGSSITTTNDSDFWGELEGTLRTFLQLETVTEATAADATETETTEAAEPTTTIESTQRSFMINRQAGLVVVRAYPDELREIENFLDSLTRRSRRQVILEAKILEVELNDGFEFGVDWMAISRGLGNAQALASEPRTGVTDLALGSASTFQSSSTVPTIVTTTSTTAGVTSTAQTLETGLFDTWDQAAGILSRASDTSPFSLALRTHDFISFINLLQTQGRVQVLSNPRISTVNNQKAVIKVGQDEYFLTDLTSNNDPDTGVTITPTFRNFFSGVALDVVPQIGEDDIISLHIHPVITAVSEQSRTIEFSGTQNVYPLAYTASRELDTMIRVRNGEMVVLGGLMQQRMEETDASVPFLGDLPLIGGMFGQNIQTLVKSELVILLRPVIVEDRQDWRDLLQGTADRIRGLRPAPDMWWAR